MRARLVTAAAAVVLLALGIALGAGPLQHDAAERERDRDAQNASAQEAAEEIEALQAQVDFGTAYTGSSASRVVAGTLEGRKVAVVSFPGVEERTVELLDGLVRAAGGEVTAAVVLAPGLLDPAGQGLLDALTRQIAEQVPGLSVPGGASGHGVFATLLARAAGVPASARTVGAPYDEAAISILSGLEAGKVVASSTVTQRANLTLFVLPPEGRSSDAAREVVATYAAQVQTVVAGPSASARAGGLLAALREGDGELSTVDSLDSSTGRVVAILALAARGRGVTGDYGVVGDVTGAIPPFP